jgi:hypothetical protein
MLDKDGRSSLFGRCVVGDEEKKFYDIATKKCKEAKVQNQKQTDRQRRFKQKE